LHYYQHHIGDFIRDTSRLTDAQAMAYLRLLWLYYESERPLPDNPQMLAMKVGGSIQEITMILEAFFVKCGSEWKQIRCESEIRKYQTKAEAARGANKARWSNSDLKSDKVSDMKSDMKSDPNQEPITNNQEPLFTTTAEAPSGTAVPGCPHKPIVDLYNRILPELSQVLFTRWEGSARAKALQARWRESENHQSLEFWERYFTALRDYPFYLGENNRSWKADLGWLVERRNFDKLLEKFVTGTP
jgi:uncharacterized protein YdaU (DUF1376 family)